jgi:hypothetical protein
VRQHSLHVSMHFFVTMHAINENNTSLVTLEVTLQPRDTSASATPLGCVLPLGGEIWPENEDRRQDLSK